MVKYSTNDSVQLSSSMASSIFHEDNIQVFSINIVEEKIFHLSSLFFHYYFIFSTSVRKSDPLDVLEEGSKIGDVAFALLGSMLLIYSYMIPSTNFQSCTKDGEALAITMAHLGLLFHLLGDDYNLFSKLMLQERYDSLGVTYSQALLVAFGHGTLVGSKFKSEEQPFLSYQCI